MISGVDKEKAAGAPPLLRVEGVSSKYGRIEVLHDVTLAVGPGQIVAIIGSNGAGKTTLLKLISGVQPITGGALFFNGSPLTHCSSDERVRRGLSQVPEGRQVFAQMSVVDNLRLGAFSRRDSEVKADIDRMYSLFPALAVKQRELAGNLSGGQQQMVAMARALMAKPKLLLLDEPSMGLSPILTDEIFTIIERLREDGVTILLVEQNAYRALSVANFAYVLESGRVALSGAGSSLKNNTKVKNAYLGG